MTQDDYNDLAAAKYLLEYAFLVNRLKAVYNMSLEWDMAALPEHVRNVFPDVSSLCVEKALSHVCRALSGSDCLAYSVLERSMTTNMNGCSGRTIPRFDVLNATMHVLLSSIEIAEFYGESIQSPETRLVCMQVFALGGGSYNDQRPDNAYLSLRVSLSDRIAHDPCESSAKTSIFFLATDGKGRRKGRRRD